MDDLLLIGVNTRPVANSAIELGYNVYSVSYYCTADFKSYHERRCILRQEAGKSCGRFHENFSKLKLSKLASEFLDRVKGIVTLTGAPSDLPRGMIIGNTDTEHIENKYRFYRHIRNSFLTPETHLLRDPDEAMEIVSNSEKEYLVKPVEGAGGFGVRGFRDPPEGEFILQEYIKGDHLSASVLSTGSEAMTILTSRQIINSSVPGFEGQFVYAGNIAPYPAGELESVAEDLVLKFSLRGSNGVDFVVRGEDVYVIELNPRIQGTFECAELSLGINMLEAHIMAAEGELIERPEPVSTAAKRIIYADSRCSAGEINTPGVHDLPLPGSVIEAGEPLVTVLASHQNPEMAVEILKERCRRVRDGLRMV